MNAGIEVICEFDNEVINNIPENLSRDHIVCIKTKCRKELQLLNTKMAMQKIKEDLSGKDLDYLD